MSSRTIGLIILVLIVLVAGYMMLASTDEATSPSTTGTEQSTPTSPAEPAPAEPTPPADTAPSPAPATPPQ